MMNKRQYLIGAIVITVLIGAIYLLTRYYRGTHAHTVATTSTIISEPSSAADGQGVQSVIGSGSPTPDLTPEAIEEDIRSRIEVVELTSDPEKRNSEYQKLVDLAITNRDLEIAAEAAKKIEVSDLRNNAYEQIEQQAINQQDFKMADEVTNKIDDAKRKEAAINKLLKAAPI